MDSSSPKNPSKFRKNFFRVASANAGSQFVILAFTPLLTRLFSPAEFGLAAIFTTMLNITASICVWKFDRIIPNSKHPREVAVLSMVGFGFLTLYCFTVFTLIVQESSLLSLWQGFEQLGSLLYLLPIAIYFVGIRDLCHSWHVWKSDMVPVSNARWFYALSYIGFSLLFALIGHNYIGLVAGRVIAFAVAGIYLIYSCRELVLLFTRKNISDLKSILNKAVPLASQSCAVTVLNTFSKSLIIVFVSQLFGLAVVGQYALVTRLVLTPMQVITKSLGLSFWSRAAELAREKSFRKLQKLYLKVIAVMILLALAVAAVSLLSRFYLPIILGSQWANTGQILVAALPLLMGNIIFASTNHLVVFDMQRLQLIADGVRVILLVSSFFISSVLDLDVTTTILLFSVSSLVGHLSLFTIHLYVYSRKLIPNSV